MKGYCTRREDDHRHGDEGADRHDHQQRYSNAFPVPLRRAYIHKLLQTNTKTTLGWTQCSLQYSYNPMNACEDAKADSFSERCHHFHAC